MVVPGSIPNGEVEEEPLSSGITLVSQEAAQVLESAGEGPLGQSGLLCSRNKLHLLQAVGCCCFFWPKSFWFADVRLRKLAEEKEELLFQIRKLKHQLDEERQKHAKVDGVFTEGEKMENGTDLSFIEMQSKFPF